MIKYQCGKGNQENNIGNILLPKFHFIRIFAPTTILQLLQNCLWPSKIVRVAGFTFIRNAILYDYPITEAIQSLLPLCDLVVVAVGRSDDDTLNLIKNLHDPRIQIIETEWDDTLREGGRVLAAETDKALAAIPPEYDWCIYIQGDECLHEEDYPKIRTAMAAHQHDSATEGLLFDYLHFYGSYDYIGASRRWYRREVRIIRNLKSIHSYRDAQGFRILENGRLRKLRVRPANATVYHYGWVKPPDAQQRKQLNFHKLWHSDAWVSAHLSQTDAQYQYNGTEPLAHFQGTHPAVMHARIQYTNWHFQNDPASIKHSLKDRLSGWIERLTGWRPGEYRNYTLLK
jgi:hypothetical protein